MYTLLHFLPYICRFCYTKPLCKSQSAGSSLPLLRKHGSKCIARCCWAERNAKITQLGHVHPNETARVDTGEGLKIHIHVQGNTVIGTAFTYFQSE